MKNEIVPYKEKEFDLESFNEETRRLDALNYNTFLNEEIFKNKSIIDAIIMLQNYVHCKRVQKINKRITNESSINLVLEFYEKLGLKENLEPILSGKHPMFDTRISKNDESSFVSHKFLDPKLTFNVGEMGTFYGIINLAHESAHAINGHYSKFSKLINKQNKIIHKFGKDSKEFQDFDSQLCEFINKATQPLKDCVTEIETHIVENLFLEFALNKNLISPEDKENYCQLNMNSMRRDIAVILQENYIYGAIRNIKESKNNTNNEITEKEYLELKEELKSVNHQDFMERLNFISKRRKYNDLNNNCKYKFRYIVGNIFATVWIDEYRSSKKQEKQKMLEDYKTFLLNNNKYNLDSAMKLLLPNENYETTINKFVNLVNYKNQELSQ